MGGATMFIDKDAAEVVAMIGRACAFLVDEYGWTPEQFRAEITAELEDVIGTHPRYAPPHSLVSPTRRTERPA